MNAENRITIDRIKAARDKTGIWVRPYLTLELYGGKPSFGSCGCPIGIVAYAEKKVNSGKPYDAIEALGLDVLYAGGFIAGFDYPNDDNSGEGGRFRLAEEKASEHDLGVQDGVAAAREFRKNWDD